MNSMSGEYNYDNCHHYKKEVKQCPTILKCGCPNGTITVRDGITSSSPVVLSTVTLNTPKCCDHCVMLEYASNVSLSGDFGGQAGPGAATFTITIFRNCSDNSRIPIGSYTYSRDFFVSPTDPDLNVVGTFSFFVCDCNNCASECCYYSAEITSAELIGTFSPVVLPIVTINNPTLSALVASSHCN